MVRIVGPAGAVSWLEKGVEVELKKNAECFFDFHEAQVACDKFNAAARERWGTPPIANVYDTEREES
jgi:hypothetical protein